MAATSPRSTDVLDIIVSRVHILINMQRDGWPTMSSRTQSTDRRVHINPRDFRPSFIIDEFETRAFRTRDSFTRSCIIYSAACLVRSIIRYAEGWGIITVSGCATLRDEAESVMELVIMI
uniref:Uncharacterized protein n=1 Tax=Steinernema glaseri TaxID=37863 RepID=A0A1I7Z7T1_9BILA